jgi:uncharacterized membrane protein YfcA
MIFGVPFAEFAVLAGGLLIGGAMTGFLAGLFGVGGGAVITPFLYEAFRAFGVPEEYRMPLCVGTSLAVIVPTAISSYLAHFKRGQVDTSILRRWAVPVVLGVMVGSVIARFAPAGLFKTVFVIVAVASAMKLLFGSSRWQIADDLPGALVMRAYGVLIGVLSSLMGIGGGQLSNLFMTVYGRPIHQAVATSSGLGILISIPGAIGFMVAGWPYVGALPPFSIGYVSLIGVALAIPTSIVFAPVGAYLAHKMPKRQLEVAFGVFLLIVAGRFLATLF